ncbi:MAG: damage-inducible protein DinB [Ignavibacteria bacterium]
MTLQEIKTLHAYNAWANNRIFDTVALLPLEHYKQEMKSSHGSIHDTLTHIVGAEKVWLERFLGNPQPFLKAENFATAAELRAIWKQVGHDTAQWIATMTDKKLQDVFEMQTLKGDAYRHVYWQAFQHVVNHSSYHRGQIVTMLRQLGAQPVSTDLIVFYRDTKR